MKRLPILFAFALCTPAWAEDQAEDSVDSAEATPVQPAQSETEADEDITVKADKPKRVCKFEKPTGSIRAVRVCYTQDELDQRERAAQVSRDFLVDEQRKRENAARNRPENFN